jgi:hypothetical protein
MPRPLDPKSKNILEFRPQINFVEPEVQPGVIDPITPDQPQLEDAYDDVEELRKLADAVNTLATALQSKVDEIAVDVKMAVTDDDDVVQQAMERMFPDDDPTILTYQQYKHCKDHILQEGINIGDQLIITPDEIGAFKDDAKKALDNESSRSVTQMGGFGTPENADGRLRPELQTRGQVIKPLKYKKLKAKLLCMLANMIWKKFVRPAFGISVAGVGVQRLLPKRLCNPGKGLDVPDIDKLIKKGAKDFKKTKAKASQKPRKGATEK